MVNTTIFPENMKRQPDAGSILAHYVPRCANIKPALRQCLVSAVLELEATGILSRNMGRFTIFLDNIDCSPANADFRLGQWRRQWANFNPTLLQSPVFAGLS